MPPAHRLSAAGAEDTTQIQVRSWHTFGHGENDDLAPIDSDMAALWEARHFTVHLLGDFNGFAERQGVVAG